MNYFVNIAKRQPITPCPALSVNDPNAVVAVMAEGEYVTILTKRSIPYADDPSQSYTTTWFDTWRFVDGKADEHWDPATLPTGPAPQAAAVERRTARPRYADREAIEALMWRYDRARSITTIRSLCRQLHARWGVFGQVKGPRGAQEDITDLIASQKDRARPGPWQDAPLHDEPLAEFIDDNRARFTITTRPCSARVPVGSATAPVSQPPVRVSTISSKSAASG